jgi:hypothetical protein
MTKKPKRSGGWILYALDFTFKRVKISAWFGQSQGFQRIFHDYQINTY